MRIRLIPSLPIARAAQQRGDVALEIQTANTQLPLPWQWRGPPGQCIAKFVMSFAEMSHSLLTDRFMLAMIPASKGANGAKPWYAQVWGDNRPLLLFVNVRGAAPPGSNKSKIIKSCGNRFFRELLWARRGPCSFVLSNRLPAWAKWDQAVPFDDLPYNHRIN
jgi:hypothetical protein